MSVRDRILSVIYEYRKQNGVMPGKLVMSKDVFKDYENYLEKRRFFTDDDPRLTFKEIPIEWRDEFEDGKISAV